MPLPINTQQADETSAHRDKDRPWVLLMEFDGFWLIQSNRNDRSEKQLDKEDRVDFPYECHSNLCIAINDCYTDFEVVWDIIV